ncbi:amino acid adenylation domain-containing protein [Kitasatospora sp. NPDC088391]|uniref:amino acid adenylation domain-containing protein n=1 Tax=Kitasatospora sp. NPDC088391 TaxID=3364074 RepID=UPI00380D63B5
MVERAGGTVGGASPPPDRELWQVVRDGAGRHAVRPAGAPPAAGWERVSGPDGRAECRAFVARHWRPAELGLGEPGPGGPGPGGRAAGPRPGPGGAVPVHEAVRARAARAPGALAVLGDSGALSYGELVARVGRLAGALRAAGVRRGDPVAVGLPRDTALVVAWLAVLESGGGLLPVDPAWPAERQAAVLERCGVAVAVGGPERPGVRVLGPDAAAGAGAAGAVPVGAVPVGAGDLAYLIHTSGSSGVPKCVAVAHGALAFTLGRVARAYGLGPGDRVLQVGALGFDTALEQVLAPLTAGAAVVLGGVDPWAPTELLERIGGLRLTVADLTPAYWHRLLELLPPGGPGPAGLRLVVVGGDVVQAADCRAFLERLPGVRLLNAYGVSEAAITSTLCEVTAGLLDGAAASAPAPIGRPLPGVRVRLLDGRAAPVPPGGRGGVHLGGPGLALGYWRDAATTAEAFGPDPWDGAPGARLYRTGDAGRLRPDGELEFLGRLDDQVKVGGFRVDPGEVEAVLAGHPDVRLAKVLADRTAPDGSTALTAYYTAPDPETARAPERIAELRAHLARHLPAFMVPAAFVPLAAMPLTAAGKIDRRALPNGAAGTRRGAAPGGGRDGAPPEAPGGAPHRAPAGTSAGTPAGAPGSVPEEVPGDALAEVPGGAPGTVPGETPGEIPGGASDRPPAGTPAGASGEASGDTTEVVVGRLWAELLGVERVGPADDFFGLGGTSLLAMEMLARLRLLVGLDVTAVRALTRALLGDPRLRAFAAAVRAARAGAGPVAGEVDWAAESAPRCPVRLGGGGRAPDRADPAEVLLTGATGFCGVHLLEALLAGTGARVHCLVRAADGAAAARRLEEAQLRFLGRRLDDPRIVALPGDLGEPLLGLGRECFDRLAGRLDAIHHLGARVNFLYPYHQLRRVNVDGTREVVRLAGHRRGVPVHYVSTLAVLAGLGAAGVDRVDERTPLARPEHLGVGYVESKWVAEQLLHRAAAEGLPVTVVRTNDVTGDLAGGSMNPDTELWALMAYFAVSGRYPAVELPLDFVPADRFARAVARIAAHAPAGGDVYHLASPRPASLPELADRMRAAGRPLVEVPYREWVRELVAFAAACPGHPIAPYVPLFVDRAPGTGLTISELYFRPVFPRFDRSGAEAALAGSGIVLPDVDAGLLDGCVAQLDRAGLLPRGAGPMPGPGLS